MSLNSNSPPPASPSSSSAFVEEYPAHAVLPAALLVVALPHGRPRRHTVALAHQTQVIVGGHRQTCVADQDAGFAECCVEPTHQNRGTNTL